MSALRIVCVLAFALPVSAADPPRPAIKKLYVIHTPSGWLLDIHDDGECWTRPAARLPLQAIAEEDQ